MLGRIKSSVIYQDLPPFKERVFKNSPRRTRGHKGLRKTRENPRKSANSAVEACLVECLNLSDCGLFIAAVTKALSGEPLQRMASREDSFDIIEQMCGSFEILEV